MKLKELLQQAEREAEDWGAFRLVITVALLETLALLETETDLTAIITYQAYLETNVITLSPTRLLPDSPVVNPDERQPVENLIDLIECAEDHAPDTWEELKVRTKLGFLTYETDLTATFSVKDGTVTLTPSRWVPITQ
jgi:hypothetical protein